MRGVVTADKAGIALRLRALPANMRFENAISGLSSAKPVLPAKHGLPAKPVAAANMPAINVIARMEGIPSSSQLRLRLSRRCNAGRSWPPRGDPAPTKVRIRARCGIVRFSF